MLSRLLRWPSLFAIFAALGAATAICWWKLPEDLTRLRLIFGLSLLAAVFTAICLLVIAGRKRRRDERLTLYLLFGNLLLLSVGQLLGPGLNLVSHLTLPAPASAILFLLASLLLGAGLLRNGGRYPRAPIGITAVAWDALLTLFVFALIVYERGLNGHLMKGGIPLAYAAGMLTALICLVVSMCATVPTYQRGPWRLLLAGAGLMLAGAGALNHIAIIQVDHLPLALFLWTLGYPLIGIAAVWEHATRPRDAGEARNPDEYLSAVSVVVPVLLLAGEALILLLTARQVLHAPQALLVFRLFVLLTILVLARLVINILRSRLAYRSLLDRVKESERVSVTDPLTGLPNKRACTQRLEDEMARAVRYKRPFSIIFGDIDFFKLVNDVHGHHAGDLVLIEVGNALRNSIRTTDMIARLGGEEFVLILPETTAAQAGILAERLREKIEKLQIDTQNGRILNITISLGIAGYPETSDTADALLQHADEAMNHAKDAGRNRVVTAKAKVNVFVAE